MPYTDHIKQLVSALPNSPGVYQYFNQEGTIIYVGKAKNLKRRVSSYFNKKEQSAKVAALVKHIYDLKYIVVETENDALLLENNLIFCLKMAKRIRGCALPKKNFHVFLKPVKLCGVPNILAHTVRFGYWIHC